MANLDVIPVLVLSTEDDDNAKGPLDRVGEVVREKIPVAVLQENLGSLVGSLGDAMQNCWEIGEFELSEISVKVEVGAKGEVSLIGLGSAEMNGAGAITLTFVRPGSLSADP